jgi:glycosyltransferase involved in cell wall biosynthesis
MSERDLLVVFSDDWGRHPSSCQHLVRELLSRYDVLWVDTIGTRPMRFDFYTLRRGFGKLAGWFKRSPSANDDATPKPDVWKPVMWPSFASRFSRALNKRLLARGLIERIGSRRPVVLTTIPVVADLVGVISARRWIYYCVDDFAVWPGLDGSTLQAMEAELVRKVDDVVVVSEPLQQRLKSLGRSSTLLTHGVNLEYWKIGENDPAHFNGVERPIVLFWGLVDRRLNVDWIAALAEKMTSGTIAFVGPQQDVDARISALPRVKFFDTVPSETLPSLANAASVLIMPYADLPVTQAMQPLKFKEYLATGKPVAVSRLPSTVAWADAADVVDSADEFAAAVVKRTTVGVDPSQLEARRRLTGESWAAKAEQLERLWRKESP